MIYYGCRNALMEEDVLNRIERDSIYFQNGTVQFLITGDMNGRSSELPDYIEIDHACHLPLPDDYTEDMQVPVRTNNDKLSMLWEIASCLSIKCVVFVYWMAEQVAIKESASWHALIITAVV